MGKFKSSIFDGNVVPSGNSTKDLGSSSKKWRSIYATNFIGNLTGNSTTTGIRWVAKTQGQKWSRICYIQPRK